MKIIRFIVGTVISMIALAIATKLAAVILGVVFTIAAIVFFVLKVALIMGIVLFVFWAISRLLTQSRRSESL